MIAYLLSSKLPTVKNQDILLHIMRMSKYAIISAINWAHADYFIGHWLPSLRATTDLSQIEIVVIDMGLRPDQHAALRKQVTIVPCEMKTHPTAARFFTIEQYLRTHNHQKAVLIDGGDIFFQRDFSPIFGVKGHKVFAAQCVSRGLFYEWFLPNCFPLSTAIELYSIVSRKPAYSAGVLVGQRKALITMLAGMNAYLKNVHHYGADQIVMNYIGHKQDLLADLPQTFNFSSLTGWEQFTIKQGKVYDSRNQLVTVVHNAGRIPLMRVFGTMGHQQKNAGLNYAGLWVRRIFSPGTLLAAWLLGKLNKRIFST